MCCGDNDLPWALRISVASWEATLVRPILYRKRPRATTIAVAVAAACLAVGIGALVLRDEPPEREAVRPKPDSDTTVVPNVMNAHTPKATGQATPTQPAPTTSARPAKPMTQDERFDALAKSESPKARFEAYRLARQKGWL